MPERAPEVEQLIHAWLDAKQAADAAGIARLLTAYDGARAIGTDGDEWFSGADAFRSAHMAGGPFSAVIETLEAHREGESAWAALRAALGDLTIRLTLVLVREDGDWRIVQSHASVPS